MKPLSCALAGWEPAASNAEDPVSMLRAEWPAIVGEDVAANSRPLEIVRDALLIVTRSSAWSHQLAFLSEPILDALRSRAGIAPERLRFRVGRLAPGAAALRSRKRPAAQRVRHDDRGQPQTLEEAFDRFRCDVAAAQRAKERAGWKECRRCGVRIRPCADLFCAACDNARAHERDARVARLLFEAPWLGYAGIAALVEGLTLHEYQTSRLRLLRRWKDALERIRRTGCAHPAPRDRMIASSYVLLKSELDPERIAPAVVRDLLGDELHQVFYGSENT